MGREGGIAIISLPLASVQKTRRDDNHNNNNNNNNNNDDDDDEEEDVDDGDADADAPSRLLSLMPLA